MRKVFVFLFCLLMVSAVVNAEELYDIDDTFVAYCTVHNTTGSIVSADSVRARIYEETTAAELVVVTMTPLDAADSLGTYKGSTALSAAAGFEAGKSYAVVYQASADAQSPSAVERFRIDGNRISNIANDLAATHAAVNLTSVSLDVQAISTDLRKAGVSADQSWTALINRIWDEQVEAIHQTAGTAGKKLDDAGAAGDPWSTALPGSYGSGTAGARFISLGLAVDHVSEDVQDISKDLIAVHTAVETISTSADVKAISYDLSASGRKIYNRIDGIYNGLADVSEDAMAVLNGMTNVSADVRAISYDLGSSGRKIYNEIDGIYNGLTNVSVDTRAISADLATFNIYNRILAISNDIGAAGAGIAQAVWVYNIGLQTGSGQAGAEVTDIRKSLYTSVDLAKRVWFYDISGHTSTDEAASELRRLYNKITTSADIWNYNINGITTEGYAGEELNDIDLIIPTAAANADAVWDEGASGHTTVGMAGYQLWTIVDAIYTDTGTDGVMVASIDETTIAKIVDRNWDEDVEVTHQTAGSAGKKLDDSGSVSAISIADAVWHAGRASHDFTGSFGQGVNAVSLDEASHVKMVDRVWDELTSGHTTVGSTGKAVADAASAGDPWATALPGAYVGDQAGSLVARQVTSVDNLQTRLTAARAGYLDYLSTAGGAILQIVSVDMFRTSTDRMTASVDQLKGAGWTSTDALRNINTKVQRLRP